MEYRKSRHILELEQPFYLASLFFPGPVATVYMLRACGMLSLYAGPERKIRGERYDCSGIDLLGAIYF